MSLHKEPRTISVAGFKTTLVFFFLNKNYFSEKCNLHWMLEEVIRSGKEIVLLDIFALDA